MKPYQKLDGNGCQRSKDSPSQRLRQLPNDKQDMIELLNTYFVTQPGKTLSTTLTSVSTISPQGSIVLNVGVQF